MVSKEKDIRIFKRNDLLKEAKNQSQRTSLVGQIVLVDQILPDKGSVVVRFLETTDTWGSQKFYCKSDNLIPVHNKLWQFVSSITSPQERVKFAKNESLCEILKNVTKDMTVGFASTNDIYLGTVKYIGLVKGMGYCYGLELNEKKKENNCDGSCAGIQYFKCSPGHGVFTTIEKILPYTVSLNQTRKTSFESNFEPDAFTMMDNDSKPKYEEIITKYGEYPKKMTESLPNRTNSYIRNSFSLENMQDIDNKAVNTNNDFDQNTVIQPDRTYLMPEQNRKIKTNSEVDLIDIIGGSWSGSTDTKQLEGFSSLRKNLDKTSKGNVKNGYKERYTYHENGIKEQERYSQPESYSTSTLTRRNKSTNILSHFVEGSGNTLKKNTSKFYTDDYIENGKGETKTTSKKHDTIKKINEKSEQLARTSTFYVNDKPKYHDPQPGTTNDLVVGTLVEVSNDITDGPLYGVIKWMGVENDTNFILVGVELEDEQSHLPLTLTDGTHNGERFFQCGENRALFVPIDQCHKDSRFQDGVPTPVHEASAVEKIECPVIPGSVAPLCMPTEEDVVAVCGKLRGIQGHHNSCYLDVTLFSMFTYTAVFDSLLFRPKNANDIDDYEEVQRVLKEEIVNPLRKNLFVSADHVMKLRRLLDRLSNVSGLTSEEKDPEEFLNSLLAQILKAEPFLKLNSGQEAFHYQLFVEKDAHLTLPTVQQLFEQSFLTSDIKLKEVPSCLIIQMPRFGKNYKMYNRILPSQLLDVTDVIEGSPRQCIVCGKLARFECRECYDDCSNAGLESTAFCLECLKTAHKHEKRKNHRPTTLEVTPEYSGLQETYRPPRLFMELFAVICIETSHYVAFVKCGVGHEAPWCFFDSMADRLGEKNGYNIPEMVACPDVSRWLSDEKLCKQLHENHPMDRHLPERARRLLCDAYICMYQSSDVMMYR